MKTLVAACAVAFFVFAVFVCYVCIAGAGLADEYARKMEKENEKTDP